MIVTSLVGLAVVAASLAEVADGPSALQMSVADATSWSVEDAVAPEIAREPEPVGEATAPVESPAEPPAAAPLPVVLDERFADNRAGWPNDTGTTTWLDAGGGYRLAARQPSRFVAVGAPALPALQAAIVTATFRKVGGPPGGGYGLIVGDQGPTRRDGIDQGGWYHVMEVGDRGEIGIWRRAQDHWEELVPWTPSDVVHRDDAPNELEAAVADGRLEFRVNGVPVASVPGEAVPAGRVGIFVGGDFNEVRLDRLMVRGVAADGPSIDLVDSERAPRAEAPVVERPVEPAGAIAAPPETAFQPITRITVPARAIDAAAVPAALVGSGPSVSWEVPAFKVGHALGSAGAGAAGNAVLVGHVSSRAVGNVFKDLPAVRVGDAIQAFSGPQRFDYRVVEVRTVARTDVSVVRPTSGASLTLLTCTGQWLPALGDYAERLVVHAELSAAPR